MARQRRWIVPYELTGGTRAVEHLPLVMGELEVAEVRAQIALTLADDLDNDQLTPRPHQSIARSHARSSSARTG